MMVATTMRKDRHERRRKAEKNDANKLKDQRLAQLVSASPDDSPN